MQKEQINLLQSEPVQSYIRLNEQVDENEIVLRSKTLLGLPSSLIADQIAGLRKAKTKLPTYYSNPLIIYPPKLNLEQSSSEVSATLKTQEILAQASSRHSILDLTGGFGVDSFLFSRFFDQVIYVEPKEGLFEIAKLNHKNLGADNIEHFHGSAERFLKTHSQKADAVYLDPSRRLEGNRKVFTFRDCEPDVPGLLDELIKISDLVAIKASPLLDIKSGIDSLKMVHQVTIISVENECKELLFILKKDADQEPVIRALNQKRNEIEEFEFTFSQERSANPAFSGPLEYLYEPNTALLKAGAFKIIGEKFGLSKLHSNTHLYTGTSLIRNFPGRTFRILSSVKNSALHIKDHFPGLKANVMVRNYPMSVDELKNKLKLNDGGEKYLIATTSILGKGLLVLSRIK